MMRATSTSSSPVVAFKVKRKEPEVIVPAIPTPYEVLYLSDIDNQLGLRFQVPMIHFYRHDKKMAGSDPANVIREGIAKALVYYYPYAGRIGEGPNDKLMVECTGDGVMFIEADSDLSLDMLGDVPRPPFPGLEQLLYNGPGRGSIMNNPLLLIQVTRLSCGGFVFAFYNTHPMSDAVGLMQFMAAIGEMACGANAPSILPVWKRELLNARDPPLWKSVHPLYNEPYSNDPILEIEHTRRSFFFSFQDIAKLKNQLPPHLQHCTRFEILTACLWRCRTIAVSPNPSERVAVVCIINGRPKFNPPLPVGFYGNTLAYAVALSNAGELCRSPLGYVLELVRKAKSDANEEFLRSYIDDLVAKNGVPYVQPGWYIVSDLSRVPYKDVDFGWGKAVYGGPTWADPKTASFFLPSDKKGQEDGIVVTMNLPAPIMDTFANEIEKIIRNVDDNKSPSLKLSLL